MFSSSSAPIAENGGSSSSSSRVDPNFRALIKGAYALASAEILAGTGGADRGAVAADQTLSSLSSSSPVQHPRNLVAPPRMKSDAEIDALILKYQGHEEELFSTLCGKYGLDPNTVLMAVMMSRANSSDDGPSLSASSAAPAAAPSADTFNSNTTMNNAAAPPSFSSQFTHNNTINHNANNNNTNYASGIPNPNTTIHHSTTAAGGAAAAMPTFSSASSAYRHQPSSAAYHQHHSSYAGGGTATPAPPPTMFASATATSSTPQPISSAQQHHQHQAPLTAEEFAREQFELSRRVEVAKARLRQQQSLMSSLVANRSEQVKDLEANGKAQRDEVAIITHTVTALKIELLRLESNMLLDHVTLYAYQQARSENERVTARLAEVLKLRRMLEKAMRDHIAMYPMSQVKARLTAVDPAMAMRLGVL